MASVGGVSHVSLCEGCFFIALASRRRSAPFAPRLSALSHTHTPTRPLTTVPPDTLLPPIHPPTCQSLHQLTHQAATVTSLGRSTMISSKGSEIMSFFASIILPGASLSQLLSLIQPHQHKHGCPEKPNQARCIPPCSFRFAEPKVLRNGF